MKKSTIYKMCAIIIQIVPLLIVLACFFPVIISRADKIISVSALFVLIIIGMVFKDATKKFVGDMSGWKTSLFVLVFCLISMSLGQQLLWLSVTALISSLLAIPFNTLYYMETRPPTNKEMAEEFSKLKGKLEDENNE